MFIISPTARPAPAGVTTPPKPRPNKPVPLRPPPKSHRAVPVIPRPSAVPTTPLDAYLSLCSDSETSTKLFLVLFQ